MPTDKATWRATLRRIAGGIDPATRAERSTALAQHLADDLRWRRAINVAAFVGVGAEPDTIPLLQAALTDGKRLWLPRVLDAAGGRSELVAIEDLSTLRPGPYGLLEPSETDARAEPAIVPSMELDVVLVPGLGFHHEGARLGHGPGHYDRMLQPSRDLDLPWRVGVCFAELFDAEGAEPLPTEDHDVPMHHVLTDEALHECGPRQQCHHVIEPATSSRAKCRSCGAKIEKGTLRFGERVDNPYGEGLATYWFHLVCGAMRRPEAFAAVLDLRRDYAFDGRERLAAHAKAALQHHRLPRLTSAQRDPSGRARCRHCRERIDKGAWRLTLTVWEDGRFGGMGFIHCTCARAYFGADRGELLARIEHGCPDLDPAQLAEIEAALTSP